jgi:hypothetical protein
MVRLAACHPGRDTHGRHGDTTPKPAQNDGVYPPKTPSFYVGRGGGRLTRSCPGPTLQATFQAPPLNGVPNEGSARSRPNEGARTVAATVRTGHR